MINRSLIRTKVVQLLYSCELDPSKNLDAADKELQFSIEKSKELYIYLFLLIEELTQLQERRFEVSRNKHFPTQEDLNPNRRFVDNEFTVRLLRSFDYFKLRDQYGFFWKESDSFIRLLMEDIQSSDIYKEYMATPAGDFEVDRAFWRNIYKNLILDNPDLLQLLEEKGLYWNDDIDTIKTFVLKVLKQYDPDSDKELIDSNNEKFREDIELGRILLHKTLLNSEEFKNMVDTHAKNWDLERVALMDVVIMECAIAELLFVPNVPINVTLNEYIELSKTYSTPRSSNFINGVLDKVVADLRKQNKLTNK